MIIVAKLFDYSQKRGAVDSALGFVTERLLAFGLIPELVVRRRILKKALNVHYQLGPIGSLPL